MFLPRSETMRPEAASRLPLPFASSRLDEVSRAESKPVSGTERRLRAGFTLPELIISMMIFSLLSVVIGTLSLAVQTAWTHSDAQEQMRLQAEAVNLRMGWMLSRAASYRMGSNARQLGVAVCDQYAWSGSNAASRTGDMLVIWSGGAGGELAGGTFADRLPQLGEIVVYTWDTTPEPVAEVDSMSTTQLSGARRLVEITFPGATQTVPFNTANFVPTMREAIFSSEARRTQIVDRLGILSAATGSEPGAPSTRGAICFQTRDTPTDLEVAAVVPGSDAWKGLNWLGGFCSGRSGQRARQVSWQMVFDSQGARQGR
ncbi:MAG: hypothetical protein C0478_07355, partial [Planctomyces sp.]|nr:hypothetical protein [Planctomyces sp.]